MALVLGDEELIKNEERNQRIPAASTMQRQTGNNRTNDGARSKSMPGQDSEALGRIFKSRKPGLQLGKDRNMPYAQADLSVSDSSDTNALEVRGNLNSESFGGDHNASLVPMAPAEGSHNGYREQEKQKHNDDAALLKEDSDFDLMQIVARRSNDLGDVDKSFKTLAKGEHIQWNGNNGVRESTYYADDGNDIENTRRNIKQTGPALGAAPGAYGAAPGSNPRRVRSIRFSNVGNSQQTADDTAFDDYVAAR
jgi:hypothetical protein